MEGWSCGVDSYEVVLPSAALFAPTVHRPLSPPLWCCGLHAAMQPASYRTVVRASAFTLADMAPIAVLTVWCGVVVLRVVFCVSCRPGLSEVCRLLLGAKLDKSCQCSNWEQRPLSRPQVEYAANDAHSLVRCFDAAVAKVGRKVATQEVALLLARGSNRTRFNQNQEAYRCE